MSCDFDSNVRVHLECKHSLLAKHFFVKCQGEENAKRWNQILGDELQILKLENQQIIHSMVDFNSIIQKIFCDNFRSSLPEVCIGLPRIACHASKVSSTIAYHSVIRFNRSNGAQENFQCGRSKQRCHSTQHTKHSRKDVGNHRQCARHPLLLLLK